MRDIFIPMKSYGEKIAERRKSKGWSQGQLAEKIGWNQSRIGNYESGARQPNESDLRVIAKALKITFNDLVSDEETKKKPLSSSEFEKQVNKLNKKGLMVLIQQLLVRLDKITD